MMPGGGQPFNPNQVPNGDPTRPQLPQFLSPQFNPQRQLQFPQQNITGAFGNMNISKTPQDGSQVYQAVPLRAQSSVPWRAPLMQSPNVAANLQRPVMPIFPRPPKLQEAQVQPQQTASQYSNGLLQIRSSPSSVSNFSAPSFPRVSAAVSTVVTQAMQPNIEQQQQVRFANGFLNSHSVSQFPPTGNIQSQIEPPAQIFSQNHLQPQYPTVQPSPSDVTNYSVASSQPQYPLPPSLDQYFAVQLPPSRSAFPTAAANITPPSLMGITNPLQNAFARPPATAVALPNENVPDFPNEPSSSQAYPSENFNQPPGTFQVPPITFPPTQLPSRPISGVVPNGYGSTYQESHVRPLPVGGPTDLNANAQPEGGRIINLLHSRKILPGDGVETPKPILRQDFRQINCSPDIFRCTVNTIPKTTALLQKSRLPLGILIHPYKDLSNLQVLACNTIVRCRTCRSYINPFVTFIDQSRWKCNLCDRTNDLPQEFYHDPVTHTVGDPQRRPEVRTATIEYIAPQEYSLRPPQPAVYVFLLDISFNAVEARYLETFCERLSSLLDRLPGDARTQICIIAFDRGIHFFQLESEWRMLTVADIDEVFIPTTDGILVRLHENLAAIKDLLDRLPTMFKTQRETHSCMGAAVQIAYKLIAPTGGRITILQTCLPSIGLGALKSREDPNMRASKEVKNLQPATDFYKTLALECSGSQIAVDLFLLAGQYADLASLSGISRYSGGSIHYYPGFNAANTVQIERFESQLTRYLSRKIGFEAVMRVRCTNGLSMHSFHGNFFVRSTDLLSLPNINPDAGYAIQVKMDENLNHTSSVSFQAALLYTSSKGERRIRVHTLHIPVTESLSELFASADQEAIATLVGKIAAERAFSNPIADVRDGIVYACEDALTAYTAIIRPQHSQLLAPFSLRLLPLFTQALLKNPAFRLGVSTTIDLRTFFILTLKCAPLFEAMLCIYPHLYAVHNIEHVKESLDEEGSVAKLERLHLSYENVERKGVYLLESAMHMILYVTKSVDEQFCRDVFDVAGFAFIPDRTVELPELETEASARLRAFISHRYNLRPMHPVLEVIREDSKDKLVFLQYLHDDRLESSVSYIEFLTQISQKIKMP